MLHSKNRRERRSQRRSNVSASPWRCDDVVAPRQVGEAAVLWDEVDAVGTSGAGQAEVLQDRHDEEKQLHTRQRLTDTRSFSCNQAQPVRLTTTIKTLDHFATVQRCFLPAENGMKAGFFLKLPFWSRKCCGSKEMGFAHCFSSLSTECSKGKITVPFKDRTRISTLIELKTEGQQLDVKVFLPAGALTYLRDGVAPEGEVLQGVVRDAEGDDVQETLDLVDDGVRKRQGLSIIHVGAPILPDRGVDLLVHFFWTEGQQTDSDLLTRQKHSFLTGVVFY